MKLDKKENIPFTQIANVVLQDKNLSLAAKGLFGILFSKPEGWDFSGMRLMNESSNGRHAHYAALNELETAGYLVRKKTKEGKNIYTLLYSQPIPENREQGKKPVPENRKYRKPVIRKTGNISNIESESNIKSESNKKLPKGKEAPDKRNPEVQKLIDCLQEQLAGIPLDGSQQENRRYAYLTLQKLKKIAKEQGRDPTTAVDMACYVIQAAHSGWHAKNATNMKYIYYNMGKIINSSKNNNKVLRV
jgi:hypothetical protein